MAAGQTGELMFAKPSRELVLLLELYSVTIPSCQTELWLRQRGLGEARFSDF